MAMMLFTGVSGLGVVFMVYVLVQFSNEGHQSKKPGTSNHLIKFSQENRPTVIVVTRPISGGLQVEPAPVSHSAHAGLSVVSRQAQMSRPSADGINEMPMKRFSAS